MHGHDIGRPGPQDGSIPPYGPPPGQPSLHNHHHTGGGPAGHYFGSMEHHPMDSSDSFVPQMESDDSSADWTQADDLISHGAVDTNFGARNLVAAETNCI